MGTWAVLNLRPHDKEAVHVIGYWAAQVPERPAPRLNFLIRIKPDMGARLVIEELGSAPEETICAPNQLCTDAETFIQF